MESVATAMTYEPVTLDHLLAHQTWAIRMARRLVHEEGEAEELVQRTWLAALRRPPDTERGARSWIRRVLQNLAHERHRRNSTRERHERESLRESQHEPDSSESVSRQEIHALLADRLHALQEPYRQVLTKRYYENLTSVEIGRRLGIPAGTVRWRLKIGLEQLRAELDRRSHGDRSKWMSALLLFAPVAPRGAEADAEPESAPSSLVPVSTAPKPIGWVAPTTWVGLAAGFVGVGWLLTHDTGRGAGDGMAVAVAAPGAGDDAARSRSNAARTLLDAPPAPTVASSGAPAGLALLVVDPAGEPVPDALVLVAGAGGFEERARTDAEGTAHLVIEPRDVGALDLPATRGRVAVRALAPGHEASALWHLAPPFDDGREVRIPVGGPDHVIRGRVHDEHGAPVAGATLAWFDLRARLDPIVSSDFPSPSYLATRSDAQGKFELAHLAAGNESLFCLAPGFALRDVEFDWVGRSADVEVELAPGATVEGVVRWPGGSPAAGVLVVCEPAQKGSEWATGLAGYDSRWHGFTESVRTAQDGSFRITGVMPGKRVVWAEAKDLVASVAFALRSGDREHWDAELEKRPGLRLRLVDETQQPLAGWIVFLRQVEGDAWWIRHTESDAEGRVLVLDCPPEGAFMDVFDSSGYGASYLGRRVRPGDQEQLVTVELRDRVVLSGALVDTLGKPVLEGDLSLCSRRTALFLPVERDAEGRFSAQVGGGNYSLVFRLGKSAVRLAEFKLAPGEQRELGSLTVPAPGTLRIVAGQATSYGLSACFDETRTERTLEVGGGTFEGEELLSLLPGTYGLLVFDGSGAPPRRYQTHVTSFQETRLDLGR